MEEIQIDLLDEKDITETYDHSKISSELLEFIIKKAELIKKPKKIKINNLCNTKLDIEKMLIKRFQEEYESTLILHNKTDILQIGLFLLGILFILLSFQIKTELWKEVFLIGGWVPIWEMIDLELFHDVREKRKRNILKKLMQCKIYLNEP